MVNFRLLVDVDKNKYMCIIKTVQYYGMLIGNEKFFIFCDK